MTRLFLLFHGRFPSEKAAALFAAKSAESFANQGLSVTLLVPRRKGVTDKDPFDFYSVKENFKIEYLPTIDIFWVKGLSFIAFWISFFVFSASAYFFVMRMSKKEDIIYSNESLPLFLLSYDHKNCFYEMHDFPESKLNFFGKFLSRMKWVLVHNKWKLGEVQKLFPHIAREKFLYEPNAVDTKTFDIKTLKGDARKKLGLSVTAKISVYTGHLYGWKGVDTLALAAQKLPEDFKVIFVGGTDKDVSAFKEKYGKESKISIVGFRSHEEMPLWQKAADVLVLPNTAKEKISAYYTSPMKLYEYMASRRPIVASDIPSIREIVDEKSAFLVNPDDPIALAQTIENAVLVPQIGDNLAEEAYKKVLSHTWDKRAERIVSFMNI